MSTATRNSRKTRPRLPEIVSKSDLADFLEMSPRHVQRLAAAGVLVRAAGGFDFAGSVRGHLAHQEENARRRRGSEAEAALRDTRTQAIERRMAREDRQLMALDEAVDGIDVVVGIFSEALDDLAVRLAPLGLSDTASVLAQIRTDLARKRDEAVLQLERGPKG